MSILDLKNKYSKLLSTCSQIDQQNTNGSFPLYTYLLTRILFEKHDEEEYLDRALVVGRLDEINLKETSERILERVKQKGGQYIDVENQKEKMCNNIIAGVQFVMDCKKIGGALFEFNIDRYYNKGGDSNFIIVGNSENHRESYCVAPALYNGDAFLSIGKLCTYKPQIILEKPKQNLCIIL